MQLAAAMFVIGASTYGYIGLVATSSLVVGARYWLDGHFSLRKYYALMG